MKKSNRNAVRKKQKRVRVVPAPDSKAALGVRGPLEDRLRAITQAASTGGLLGPNARLTLQAARMEVDLVLGTMRARVDLERVSADRERTDHLRRNASLRREMAIGYPVGGAAKAGAKWVRKVLEVAAPVDGAEVH